MESFDGDSALLMAGSASVDSPSPPFPSLPDHKPMLVNKKIRGAPYWAS